MNIYALKNHKVRCTTITGGYDYDENLAKQHLVVGTEYIIHYTEVDDWSTKVCLKEFPTLKFNSIFFEDVVEQSVDLDSKHPDYCKFN